MQPNTPRSQQKDYKVQKIKPPMQDQKAQASLNLFVGLVIIMIGVLSVTFMGLGFIFNNPPLIWVGSVVLGIVTVISAILEKVLLP